MQFGVFSCTFWSYIDSYEQLSSYLKHPTPLPLPTADSPATLAARFSQIVRDVRAAALPRTDAGRGRAFVRLALQGQLLSAFVLVLAQDRSLSSLYYADCALLRHEDALFSAATLLSALSAFDFSALQPHSALLDLANPFSSPIAPGSITPAAPASPMPVSHADWHISRYD